MALLQPVEFRNSGVDVTYWRIARVQVDFVNDPGVEVTIFGYASAESRQAGKAEMTAQVHRFGVGQLGEMGASLDTLTRGALYEAVRAVALPQATDV